MPSEIYSWNEWLYIYINPYYSNNGYLSKENILFQKYKIQNGFCWGICWNEKKSLMKILWTCIYCYFSTSIECFFCLFSIYLGKGGEEYVLYIRNRIIWAMVFIIEMNRIFVFGFWVAVFILILLFILQTLYFVFNRF